MSNIDNLSVLTQEGRETYNRLLGASSGNTISTVLTESDEDGSVIKILYSQKDIQNIINNGYGLIYFIGKSPLDLSYYGVESYIFNYGTYDMVLFNEPLQIEGRWYEIEPNKMSEINVDDFASLETKTITVSGLIDYTITYEDEYDCIPYFTKDGKTYFLVNNSK